MKLHDKQHFFALALLFAGPGHRPWESIDRAISPLDNPDIISSNARFERNLYQLDRLGSKNKIDLKPWADGLWPVAAGVTAARYADSNYTRLEDWHSREEYVRNHPVQDVLREHDANKRARLIDALSPAEKYDLLVGDDQGTLAAAQWAIGADYVRKGTLASWMGICEGSAGASAFWPEPKHSVDLRTPQGDLVRFHVLDIKGLASLTWSSYTTHFPTAGSRCNSSSRPRDNQGIINDEACFNSNPGTWHIAALNYIGKRKEPFFINRTGGPEVWNVPVLGYKMRYFNVINNKHSDEIAKTLIALRDYARDPYRNYRSPEAVSLVGVEMTLTIAAGYTNERDGRVESERKDIDYVYDLELNANGEIVGGEWIQEQHPDFIWAVAPAFEPHSLGDDMLGANERWEGNRVPQAWLEAARAASHENQALAVVMRKLLGLSRQ